MIVAAGFEAPTTTGRLFAHAGLGGHIFAHGPLKVSVLYLVWQKQLSPENWSAAGGPPAASNTGWPMAVAAFFGIFIAAYYRPLPFTTFAAFHLRCGGKYPSPTSARISSGNTCKFTAVYRRWLLFACLKKL